MALVSTDEGVEAICLEILALPATAAIGIDTETTGLNLWTADVVRGVCLAYRDRQIYVPVSHPESRNVSPEAARRLAQAVQHTPALHCWHNAIFDWTAMAQLGMEPRYEHFWDSAAAAWAMDENQSRRLKDMGAAIFGEDAKAEQTSLKALFRGRTTQECYKQLRAEGWPVQAAKLEAKDMAMASRKTWGTLTAEDIAPYGAADASLTLRLYGWQRNQLNRTDWPTNPGLDEIDRHFRVLGMTHRMIRRGVLVDISDVEMKRAKNLARIWEIEPTFEGINLHSPKQLAKLVYDDWGLPCTHHTKTGARSTAREALEELDGAHDSLNLLLEYRRLAKVVSTYYDPIRNLADTEGRTHPGLNPNGTSTGRYSCSSPNMQNIPREDTNPEVKKVFRADPGMELWEYDLKSAELYVGGSVAADDDMLAALDTPGRDFHTETEEQVWGTSGPNRSLAKALNYGCVPPGTLVLTSDLRWVPAESLSVGDSLLAFDENGPWRQWSGSVVCSTGVAPLPSVRIHFEGGTSQTCSDNHPWLTVTKRGEQTARWRTPDQLVTGDRLVVAMPTWESGATYEHGYVSGILDGELRALSYRTVSQVEHIGMAPMVMLGTSSKTYLANGLAAHNTPYGIGPAKFACYLVKGTGRALAVCDRCQAARLRDGWPPMRPVPGCDECFARSLIRKHKMTWPKTHRAMAMLTDYAKKTGYLPLMQPGHFRRFRSSGRFVSYYTAFNAAVQGGVADCMKNWMLAAEAPLASIGAYMVLQVHDSLWVQVPAGQSDTVAGVLQGVLDEVNPFKARLTIDSKRLA